MLLSFSAKGLYLAAAMYGGGLLGHLLTRERLAAALLAGGLAVQTASLLVRGWHYGIFTSDNLVTEIYFLPWCVALLALGMRIWGTEVGTALSVLFPVCFFSAIAIYFPPVIVAPDPKHDVALSTFYFFFEGVAHACFFVAGWLALRVRLKRSESLSFDRFAIWGFVLYSVAQVVGAVWCYLGWSVPFHWSEKHLLSACLWCFYCAYLHLGFSSRWTVRGKSWFALAGFPITFVIAYNYYVHYLGGKGA